MKPSQIGSVISGCCGRSYSASFISTACGPHQVILVRYFNIKHVLYFIILLTDQLTFFSRVSLLALPYWFSESACLTLNEKLSSLQGNMETAVPRPEPQRGVHVLRRPCLMRMIGAKGAGPARGSLILGNLLTMLPKTVKYMKASSLSHTHLFIFVNRSFFFVIIRFPL